MLLPMDPKQRPELWVALREHLAREDFAVVIKQGRSDLAAQNRRLSPVKAKALIADMETDAVCRISASRGRQSARTSQVRERGARS